MKKILLCLSVLFCLVSVVGCSEQEKTITGEFLLGQFGADWKEETFHLVVPIKWTGGSPVTIKSIELIKSDEKPITYEEDGINYEVFGANPLKSSGIYTEPNIGNVKDISNLEIKGEGKIVLKLSLKDVEKDSKRRLKIKFNINGEESEKIVVWKTLELLTTDNN